MIQMLFPQEAQLERNIAIINANGQVVFNTKNRNKQLQIPTDTWRSGIYYIQTHSTNVAGKTHKIILP
jgi:hypothetical protein